MNAIVKLAPGDRLAFDDLVRILTPARLDLCREAAAQADLETYLRNNLPEGCGFEREVRLGPGDRPDFMVDGRFVIEMKVSGAVRRATTRQVLRYAEHGCVEGIVLATNVAMPAARALIGTRAVPFRVVQLGRAWL